MDVYPAVCPLTCQTPDSPAKKLRLGVLLSDSAHKKQEGGNVDNIVGRQPLFRQLFPRTGFLQEPRTVFSLPLPTKRQPPLLVVPCLRPGARAGESSPRHIWTIGTANPRPRSNKFVSCGTYGGMPFIWSKARDILVVGQACKLAERLALKFAYVVSRQPRLRRAFAVLSFILGATTLRKRMRKEQQKIHDIAGSKKRNVARKVQ